MKFSLLSALIFSLAFTSTANAACFYLIDDTYTPVSNLDKTLEACKQRSAYWGASTQMLFVTSGPGFKIYLFINNGNVTETKMFPSN